MASSYWHFERRTGATSLCKSSFGYHRNSLTDEPVLEGSAITDWGYTVSPDANNPRLVLRIVRLQTVSHSILSTRIVLHISTVLKQNLVDSRPKSAAGKWTSLGDVPDESLELQER